MAFVEWTSELDIGNSLIDAQHKELVQEINEFHDMVKRGAGLENLERMLAFLTMYVEIHFASEEQVFKPLDSFEEKEDHIEQHRLFDSKVNGFRDKLKDPETCHGVLEFLKHWLIHHIAVEDKKYAAHLPKMPKLVLNEDGEILES